ncbi:MAG: glycoside hydrolase family 97 catalytic domain-containing protein [Prevotella sp.]|nr:glycoside hydrolase family 97 catalytic domain-containing protein [Prevotella sp.]
MKQRLTAISIAIMSVVVTMAQTASVTSPDGKLQVNIDCQNGQPTYTVNYDGKSMLTPSALGLKADIGDFSKQMKLKDSRQSKVDRNYTMTRTKMSAKHYVANQLDVELENADGLPLTVTFLVSDNDIAFRYSLTRAKQKDRFSAVITAEATSFNFPDAATSFICPQSKPMVGFAATKPSYEEEYKADAPLNQRSAFGEGYTFPCLFHIGNDGWVLVSETGTGSNYCGTHLSDYEQGRGYTIAFPNEKEMRGVGSSAVGIALPFSTPWRTITVGATLKPIVETTVAYDVVEPLYEPKTNYRPGRYTWGWLIWQDGSTIYDDQIKMIDVAAAMGYEYTLVDALWDTQIGRNRVEQLSKYAQGKGVRLLLWYNSNGSWNDAPQGPRHGMSTAIAREREMAWMEKIGVAGIKVDFFGSDKQQMIQLYEDILSDANRHGLQVIFHGCTLPRGWERMYPNFVASEAVLASENVFFSEHHAKQEGFELTMHPFGRNAVAATDWGGVMMNHHMSRDNKSRHQRYTSDIFEMASSIVLQTSVNCVAIYPNNLEELDKFELDFLREIPTTWSETQFIDGYPTRFVVMARRTTDGHWYVGGLNGTQEKMTITLSLPMMAGKTVRYYTDKQKKKDELLPTPELKTLKIGADGKAKVTMQPMGGIILAE